MKHKWLLFLLLNLHACYVTAQREVAQLNPYADFMIPTGKADSIAELNSAIGVGLGLAVNLGKSKRHALLVDLSFGALNSKVGLDPGFYANAGVGYGFYLSRNNSSWTIRPQCLVSWSSTGWTHGSVREPSGTYDYESDRKGFLVLRPGLLTGYWIGNLWIGLQLQYSIGELEVSHEGRIERNGRYSLSIPRMISDVSWRMVHVSPTVVLNL